MIDHFWKKFLCINISIQTKAKVDLHFQNFGPDGVFCLKDKSQILLWIIIDNQSIELIASRLFEKLCLFLIYFDENLKSQILTCFCNKISLKILHFPTAPQKGG